MATSDGRGGFVELNAVNPETMMDWSKTLPKDMPVTLSEVYRGKDTPLDIDYVARTFVTPKRITAFKDLFWVENKMLVISERLRDIIEAHDPGVHHIWPIEVLSKKGVAYPDALYGFVPAVHAAAILETEGDVNIREERISPPTKLFPLGGRSPHSTRLEATYDAAVDAEKLPSRHIWWDHGLTRNYLLLSDQLHDAIVAAGLKVIPMKKVRLLKEIKHA